LFAVGSASDDSFSENVYTLNTITGFLELIGSTGISDIDSLTVAQDGFLYGVDSVDGVDATLYQISTSTGLAEPVGLTGVTAAGGISSLPFCLGDVNCDGSVNLLDVGPFVNAVSLSELNPKADINQDGSVDLLDVGGFIEILTAD